MVARTVDNTRVKLSSVLAKLAGEHSHLSIATGFWDLKGLALIFEHIRDFQSVRLLIGQEPKPPAYLDLGGSNQLDLDFPERQLRASLVETEQSSDLRSLVSELAQMIGAGRFQVRVYRGDFLHAKTYIFGDFSSEDAVGIIGSSNFTQAGLTGNLELNAVETDARVVRWRPTSPADEHGHLSWFNEIWSSDATEDWDGRFAEVVQLSPAGDLLYSPRDMYFRVLYELYGDELVPEISASEEIEEALFDFQIRNSRLLLRKLEKYGLAMLADSVGLGKTITAGAVMRHYIEELAARRVYVVAPASLTTQWREDLARVNGLVSGFEVISMQDLARVREERRLDRFADVDLFVIDEAHNLRSGGGARHDELLEWFSDNEDSHVLLLTATPINNSLNDFVAQIQLAAKGKLESFPVVYPTSKKTEVIDFYEAVQRLSNELRKHEKAGKRPDFDKIHRVMRQGLRHFLVRTTRAGIENEFGGVVRAGEVVRHFPRSKVIPTAFSFSPSITPALREILVAGSEHLEGINLEELGIADLLAQTQRTRHPLELASGLEKLSHTDRENPFEIVFRLLLLLGFAPYKADLYKRRFFGKSPTEVGSLGLPSEESFRVISQMSVHNMLRVNLLKRLESSQHALRKSLINYGSRLSDFEKFLDQGFITSIKNIQALKGEFENDLDFFNTASDEIESMSSPADPTVFDLDALRLDLARDKRILNLLLDMCDVLNKDDTKVSRLAELLAEVVSTQTNGGKVLIFSYFTDTVEYLKDQLPSLLPASVSPESVAFTVGETRSKIEKLSRRFSPISKGGQSDVAEHGELSVLVASDVLSEGQNLQDCGVLINFDLHWNPVRMIQRNGRVNRLGSPHEEILIYNIHPDINLDQYLTLVSRLEQKIDRIRFTVGTDQSVLGEAANPIEYVDELDTETAVGELLAGLYDPAKATESFTQLAEDNDFLSEDEFVLDLRRFEATASADDRARVQAIPLGKWGLLTENASEKLGKASVLALVKVRATSQSNDRETVSHIFVSTTEAVGPVESVDALRALRTDLHDHESRHDTIAIDRDMATRRSIQVARAQSSRSRSAYRITPSIARILDALKSQVPELNVALALRRVSSKQELKRAKTLLTRAAREFRAEGLVREETILMLREMCGSLLRKEETSADGRESQFQGVVFFGR